METILMAKLAAPDSNRTLWILLSLLGLTVFALAPLLWTGYYSDDAANSLLPGVLKVEGFSPLEYVRRMVMHTVGGGRFFPLHIIFLYLLFYLVKNVIWYKAYILACVLLDIVLFYYLIRQIGRDRAFAGFATCLVIPLFQFRAFFDPILAFFGMLQLVVAGVLASLLMLQLWLDTNKRRWFVLSVATYLTVALTYEVTYPLCLLHLVLIWHGRRGWKERFALPLPFFGTAGMCLLASILLRWFYLNQSSDYKINTDPSAFLIALARQTWSALPLSYFLNNHASLYPPIWDLWSLAKLIGTPGGLAVYAGTLVVCFACLRHLPTGTEGLTPDRMTLMSLLGLLLGVLPAVLISLSFRYQKMVAFGIGYLPVYAQYFGVGLLLATLAWFVLSRVSPGGSIRRWLRVATAVLVATVASVTYRANSVLVDNLEKQPDAVGFNPVVGNVWGCWNHQRKNLECALHAGLLENVPDHSVLLLANDYPDWHNVHHSKYFYAMHGAKTLVTVPLTTRCLQEGWFLTKSSNRPPGHTSTAGPFMLRDVCLSEKAGYVILSQDAASDPNGRADQGAAGEGGKLWLFVRHPKLFRVGPNPAFLLSGERSSSATGVGGQRVVCLSRELTMVRSGRDWGLFSLPTEAGDIDPASLALAFGPVSASWGTGFYGPEVEGAGWSRWCQQRGVLYLNNVTDTPRKVNISMLLQGKGDAPLVLAGGPVHTEVSTGLAPIRFERELTLAPGSHPVDLYTEASPVAAPPQNPRTLYFRIINFHIRDKGSLKEGGSPTSPNLAKRNETSATHR